MAKKGCIQSRFTFSFFGQHRFRSLLNRCETAKKVTKIDFSNFKGLRLYILSEMKSLWLSKQFLANPLYLPKKFFQCHVRMASCCQSLALSVHFVVPRLAHDSNLIFYFTKAEIINPLAIIFFVTWLPSWQTKMAHKCESVGPCSYVQSKHQDFFINNNLKLNMLISSNDWNFRVSSDFFE